MFMKLVIIGSPGAGKGTQAKKLSKVFDIAHISTGELLREQIELRTELGKQITDLMNSGKLVPNEVVTSLLSERIKRDDCKKGYILDGYPRNVVQAEGLYDIIGDIDKVILINIDDDTIVERMVGRVGCPKCGHMYHTKYNPTKINGICDVCSNELVQREDDTEGTVKQRLIIYHETIIPIVEYYDKKNVLLRVNGIGNIEDITSSIVNSL